MKLFVAVVMLVAIFATPAYAEKINPDFDLVKFWTHSNSDQDESIDVFITQLAYVILKNGSSFAYNYSSLHDKSRISTMKACMKRYGIPHGSIGEAYVLCVQKLRWLNGVN